MKNKSTSQSVLIGLFLVLACAILSSSALADTTTWSATGAGNWFTDSNWSNGVPNYLKDTYINNGGGAEINNVAEARSLILGNSQGDSGGVTVDGAYHILEVLPDCNTVLGDIYVGKRGNGTMAIQNQGTVLNAHAYLAQLVNPSRPASNGSVKMVNGSVWQLSNDCSGGDAGLFIGCTPDSNGAGGTATVDLSDYSTIKVVNRAAAPGVMVGRSGTLTGNGVLSILEGTSLSQTAKVFGTLAPVGGLVIAGNLTLDPNAASMVCHVTPTNADTVSVTQFSQTSLGGVATLGGRLTVIMSGTFTPGTSITLLHADVARNGFFSNESIMFLNAPPCISAAISYDANNVNLVISRSCADEP